MIRKRHFYMDNSELHSIRMLEIEPNNFLLGLHSENNELLRCFLSFVSRIALFFRHRMSKKPQWLKISYKKPKLWGILYITWLSNQIGFCSVFICFFHSNSQVAHLYVHVLFRTQYHSLLQTPLDTLQWSTYYTFHWMHLAFVRQESTVASLPLLNEIGL